ncbi:TlpA family protein disulfide reductase [Streptomyces wuyuanensis]|uniref:TlpA family protein disulfide reductase n=1 Tax=Streptomyces wuyuanensis TaxID=1196353 RepID=UPI0037F47D29
MSLKCPSRLALSASLVAIGALSLSACGNGDVSQSSSQTNYVMGEGGISTVPRADRKSPSAIKGETIDGETIDFRSLRGQVIVVNVWGSWCPPCRAEAPYFAKVHRDTKSKGVAFVGINTRDANRQVAKAFEENYEIEYPSLYDPTGKLLMTAFPKGTLSPQGIPSTIVLDRDGRIAARALRAVGEEDLRRMVAPLIAEKKTQ